MFRFARPGWPLTALPSCLGWYWHLDCLDRPSTHGIEAHGYVLQVTRKLEDQPLQFPCMISGLEATLVERHFGLVPLSVAHRCTDADILEQGIGSLLTSRGCRGLIEHIIQCMYYLYSLSWGAVMSVGYATYGFTDLRPPLPLPRAAPFTRIGESNRRRKGM